MRDFITQTFASLVALQWGVFACSEPTQNGADGAMRAAPAALVDGSGILVEPMVGPEIGTDKPVAIATTTGNQPSLATDGTGFLAVQIVGTNARATRVDGNGNLLDLIWINLGENGVTQYTPDVAYGAGHYLVTWAESPSAGSGTVHGRFVTSDGKVEGTASFQLSSGQGLYPSVVWDGSHFVATWLGLENDSNSLRFVLLNADGTQVTGSEKVLSSSGHSTNPRVAAGTNGSFISWLEYESSSTYYNVVGSRIDKSGAILDSPVLALGAATYSNANVAVGSSGSSYLVAWNTTDSNYAVRGSIVDSTGSVVKNDFAISHSAGNAAGPTIDFDGANFLVAWADSRKSSNSIFGVNVSPVGEVNGTVDKELSTGGLNYVSSISSDRVNLACNGSRHLLSFYGSGIEGSLIEKDLNVLNGRIALTALPNAQGFPHLVWDGTNYVVAWTDERDSSTHMSARAVRIDTTGTVLDPDGIIVTAAGSTAFDVALSSAGKNSSQLMYFDTGVAPSRRTLASDGTLSSAVAFGSAEVSSLPTLSSNGTTYIATSMTGDSSNGAVVARIWDVNGVPGTEFKIDSSTVNTGPSAVPVAGGYLLSYAKSGTRVATVSDSGQIGTSELLSTAYTNIQGAWSGSESLIAWGSYSDNAVRGRFFKDGAWSGAEFVLAETSGGYSPAVAWDGTAYFVAWETSDYKLLGRTVSRTGVLGNTRTLVSGDECSGPVLASNASGQMLLSYIKWLESAASRRIYSRLLTPPGGAAGSGGATGSGGTVGAAGGSSATSAPGSGGATSSAGTLTSAPPIASGGTSAVGSTPSGSGGTTTVGSTAIGVAGAGNPVPSSGGTTAVGSIPSSAGGAGTPLSASGGSSAKNTAPVSTGGNSTLSGSMGMTGGSSDAPADSRPAKSSSSCAIDPHRAGSSKWTIFASAFAAILLRRRQRRP